MGISIYLIFMNTNIAGYRGLFIEDCFLLPDLLREVWGISSEKRFWEWKYFLPPFEADGWIVEDAGRKIAAFTGYWSRRTKLGDGETDLVMLTDVMAAPESRGKRFFSPISKCIKKILEEKIIFGFTNEISHNLFKTTMQDFVMIEEHIPVYTLPIHFGVYVDFNIYAKKIAGWFSRIFVKSLLHLHGDKTIRIERTEKIEEEFERLWESVKNDYYAIQYRDTNFLEWRYLRSPIREYQIWSAKKDNTLVGYLVTTLKDESRLRKGFIVDWLVSKRNNHVFEEMVRAALLWMIQCRVDVVETWLPAHEKDRRKILRKLLFLKNRRTCGFLLGGSYSENGGHPFKMDDFFFTMGDSDYLCI